MCAENSAWDNEPALQLASAVDPNRWKMYFLGSLLIGRVAVAREKCWRLQIMGSHTEKFLKI